VKRPNKLKVKQNIASSHPRLPKLSEEMKAWSAALTAEVTTWPKVTTRSMFGFNALYRNNRIFAALPKTRGMRTPNSFGFKLEGVKPKLRAQMQSDPRIGFAEMRKARWFTFEISSDADFRKALEWLSHAYEAAS
jgi:hypothetical protein